MPTPDGPRNTTFSARSTNARLASSMICFARCAGGEVEVVLIESPDRGEAGDAREHIARPSPARFTLRAEQLLDEVGERGAFLGGFLGERGILRGDAAEPEFVAQLDHTLMLDVHPASAVISAS